jgi:hypothetical protein
MKMNQGQIEMLAKYLSDTSKIIFGSVVVNFFLQNGDTEVTTIVFLGGAFISIVFLGMGILLTKPN